MNTKVFMHAIVATAMLATATTFTACLNSHADNGAAAKVESVELIRTSQSWDGVELPDYFQGRPELVAVKYVFPPGQKLGHELRCTDAGRADHYRTGWQDQGGTRGRGRS